MPRKNGKNKKNYIKNTLKCPNKHNRKQNKTEP